MKLTKSTHPFVTGLDGVIKVLSWVAIACMAIMMIIVVINVLGRLFLDKPILGTMELVELLMVPTCFFAMFYTAQLRGHVIIDLVFRRLPRPTRAIAASLGFLLCFGIWGVITYRAAPIAWSYWQDMTQDTPTLSIPYAPFRSLMVLAGLVLCLRLLVCAFHPLELEEEPQREAQINEP